MRTKSPICSVKTKCTIPESQTVSLQVSPEPNQQPCPQPSVEPDTLSVPAVLNTLFGGESATNHDPQPLNLSNNIPLGATVSAKLKQKNWDNSYFDIRLLLPNQQDDNFSVSVERRAINFQQGKFQKFPLTNGHQHFSYMHPSSFRKHLLMQLIFLNAST